MVTVAIAEFRAHMARYLADVQNGQVILLTSHGTVVAELKRPADRQAEARQRLAELATVATVGDVVSPAIDDFEAM